MRAFSPLLLLFLLPPPGPPAQTALVHPRVYAHEEGTVHSNTPFSIAHYQPPWRTSRRLQVHDNLLKRPRKIVGLAFRREGIFYLSAYPAYRLTLELSLSTARTTSLNVNPVFAANHGPDLTVVIPKTTLRFPATVPVEELPHPTFDYLLSFPKKPFTLAAGKGLCWDAKVYDNDLVPFPQGNPPSFDAATAFGHKDFLSRPLGMGSFAPGRSKPILPRFTLDWSYPPASVWNLGAYLENGPAGGAAFLLFSRNKAKTGIPLPGGGGLLYLDPSSLLLVTGPQKIDFLGSTLFHRYSRPGIPPVPAYPSLYGSKIYGQFVCVSPGSKALYASRAAILQFPRKWPRGGGPDVGTCSIYSGPLGPRGSAFQLTGLVTCFLLR